MYSYEFPDLYGELLRLITEASRQGRLPAAVLWELHDLPTQRLPLDLFTQTVDYLSKFLWELRLPVRGALV